MLTSTVSSTAATSSYYLPSLYNPRGASTYTSSQRDDVLAFIKKQIKAFEPIATSWVAAPSGITKSKARSYKKTRSQITDIGVQGASYVTGQAAPWYDTAVEKVTGYSALQDGWKGDNSLAPSADVISDAQELILQLAMEMPDLSAPMISADEEGSVCFYWNNAYAMGTIATYGDRTYSFFAEGTWGSARSDAEPIGQPIPSNLITAMTGGAPADYRLIESLIAA